MGKPNSEAGSPHRIYFDSEALSILDAHASALGPRNRSMVVCALLRALAGIPPRASEAPIINQLKKVFGREMFIAFLRAVAAALPKCAVPIDESQREDFEPEAWRVKDSGVLAFFSPSGPNIGAIFTKASALKSAHKFDRVFVVTTNDQSVDAATRQDLAAAKIIIVSLSEFDAVLKQTLKLK